MVKNLTEATQALPKHADKSLQSSQTSEQSQLSANFQTQVPRQQKVNRKTQVLKLVGGPAVTIQPLPLKLRQSQHLQLVETSNKNRIILAQHEQKLLANRYRLLELHGEGGLGKVYKAEDTLLGIPVAIKILHPSLTADSRAVNDLKQEARIAMRLSHSHIVRLHNLDKHEKNYFLVMEYVPGRSLRAILQVVGKLSPETVKAIMEVCGSALSFAHAQGVLHKDLKPDNMIVTEDGVLKIVDFSISSFIGFKEDSDYVAGTPVYMSPEQMCGEPLDPRTDIYSLGIVAYELLTGLLPFPEDAKPEDILSRGYVPLDDLDPEYNETKEVLKKAVEFDRNKRWEKILEFTEAFAHAIDSDTKKKASISPRQRRVDYSNKPTARIRRQRTQTQESL
jgi:serine/threonine protein kinase